MSTKHKAQKKVCYEILEFRALQKSKQLGKDGFIKSKKGWKVQLCNKKKVISSICLPNKQKRLFDDIVIRVQRGKLCAWLIDGGEIRENYKWVIWKERKIIFVITVGELYGDHLDEEYECSLTHWDWVSSEEYGNNLLHAIELDGIEKVKACIEGRTDDYDEDDQ